MRVLQIVQQPARRGAEIFARQLSRQFIAQGVATRTLFLYDSVSGGRLELEPDDRVLSREARPRWEKLAVDPRLLTAISAEVDAFRPDIVQLNGGRAVKYGAALRWLKPGAAFRTVYRNIGDPRQWIRGLLKQRVFRHAVFPKIDGLVCLTEETRALLTTEYGVTAPTTVVPSGISPEHLVARSTRAELRERWDTPHDAVVVLSVGSLSSEKRVDRLLKAVTELDPALEAFVWIAGDGPERARLQDLVAALGLAKRVRFLGAQEDVGSVYSASDVFALTSDTEGMPAVILEAAFSGLPVVATNVGAVRRCVVEDSALLVEPSDDRALVAALQTLAADAVLRSSMGAKGKAFVVAEFLIDRIATRYLAFFEKLVYHGALS